MKGRTLGIAVTALLFSFLFVSFRDWIVDGQAITTTFSQWQLAVNFLIFWLVSFVAALAVFLGVDYLATRNRTKNP